MRSRPRAQPRTAMSPETRWLGSPDDAAAYAGPRPDLAVLARPDLDRREINAAVQSRVKFEHLVEPGAEGGSLAIIAVLL